MRLKRVYRCSARPGSSDNNVLARSDEKVEKFEVTLGAHVIGDKQEAGRVTFTADGVIVNDNWQGITSGNLGGDIALLHLPEDAPLSGTVTMTAGQLPSCRITMS